MSRQPWYQPWVSGLIRSQARVSSLCHGPHSLHCGSFCPPSFTVRDGINYNLGFFLIDFLRERGSGVERERDRQTLICCSTY